MSPSTIAEKRRALLLVISFTLLSAAAQVLFKFGTNRLHGQISLLLLATDFPLIFGMALYGIGAAMMVLALRHGELSVLYPLISLSYVWVAILSVAIFGEAMNPFKVGGICVIMIGVGVLGAGAHK